MECCNLLVLLTAVQQTAQHATLSSKSSCYSLVVYAVLNQVEDAITPQVAARVQASRGVDDIA